MSHGIDLYVKGDFEGAIREFSRALGLSPYSEFTNDATKYLADTYLKLGKPDKAITAYKKSIRLNPTRDDTHIKLGNLYFGLDRYEDAYKEYREAVRINPDANNSFSLGQACLRLDRLNEAEGCFSQVRRLEPQKPDGDYGLGLVYSKQGRYEKAVEHFRKAIRLDKDFYDAYAEMGYAFMDMGEPDEAKAILEFLDQKDPTRAFTLSRYIYRVD
ncbi:MAG: hypothetical protein DRH37_09465, partial [Deltaproteobacteria bacterium]